MAQMTTWESEAREVQDTLHVLVQQQTGLSASLLKRFPAQQVLRIFQIDAMYLEGEILSILKSALNHVLAAPPALERIKFRFPEELELILQLVLYKFGVWDRNQSVWDRMQNLIYRDERVASEVTTAGPASGPLAVVWTPSCAPTRYQKLLHVMLTIILPFCFQKLMQRALEENWAAASGWRPIAFRVMRVLTTITQALRLGHALWFLKEGKYRSLVDRLLRMRLVQGEQTTRRVVNLMLLNQHVSWGAWSAFIAVLSTLLRFGERWDRLTSMGGSLMASVQQQGQGVPLRDGYCCACREPAVLGRRSNCGHLYCYVCIASRLRLKRDGQPPRQRSNVGEDDVDDDEADTERPSFPCMQCGASVTACTSGAVVAPSVARSTSTQP